MHYRPENPLIVQSDRSLLLETANPRYEEVRDELCRFAELVKSPEYIHTYRLTPLSLWNSAAVGMAAEELIDLLERFSKYEVPSNIRHDIREYMSRYGRIKLHRLADGTLRLDFQDDLLCTEVAHQQSIQPYIVNRPDRRHLDIELGHRGTVKQALVKLGYPVEDLAGYEEGTPLDIELRDTTLSGQAFELRPYQRQAVEAFWQQGSARGGSGVVVLPCGAGKTVIGIGALEQVGTRTLVLVTNTTAARQWRQEILDKTTLGEEDVTEYTGHSKEIGPVTIATYQILTWRASREDGFKHFDLFDDEGWGLIIYDEVHLLPAPVFRATAEIQARRRLGLTATLIREDGQEDMVFSLIGPKRYELPWKVLEKRGWIAEATCVELRVPFANDEDRLAYATASTRQRYRVAASNPVKTDVVLDVLDRHQGDQILVIGFYVDQLRAIAERLALPLITGSTPQSSREELFGAFKRGEQKVLIVSKVANFAVDLPDASVAIQISGTFGSRQEEAQRLGRLLRPKTDGLGAIFYSIVTRDTCDQDFAAKRQLFLTEQGYEYRIEDVDMSRLSG